MPAAMLAIEAIGDDTARRAGGMRRNWVAEIRKWRTRRWIDREFVDGLWDYSRANSKGSRGVFVHYILEEGKLYEVSDPQSWTRIRRYFCTVEEGRVVELDDDEAEALANRLAEREAGLV